MPSSIISLNKLFFLAARVAFVDVLLHPSLVKPQLLGIKLSHCGDMCNKAYIALSCTLFYHTYLEKVDVDDNDDDDNDDFAVELDIIRMHGWKILPSAVDSKQVIGFDISLTDY